MAVTSAKQVISISVPANDAQGLSGDGSTYQRFNSSPFNIKVSGVADNNDSNSIIHFGLYEWDFSINDIESYLGVSTLRSVKIVMYYSNADNPQSIGELGIYNLGSPLSTSNSSLYTTCLGTTGNLITSVYPTGDQKTRIEYNFTGEISELETLILSQSKFTILLKPTDTSIGGTKSKESQILIGGMSLIRGIETEWEEASSTDISDPPRLIMEWESDINNYPQHLMKYTTASSPYSNQNTPSASLGGYVAPNLINTRVQLEENIDNTQTVIPIQSSDSLPLTTSGLVHIGSEIMSYNGIDTDNNQLTEVTRSVVPPFAYPAISQPFPEFVHYLDVNNLFDTKPTENLIQYRCVAIQQQSLSSSSETTFPKVILTQNPNSNVVIDIGLEVPKWDVHNGTFLLETLSGNEVRSTTATSGSSLGVVGYSDGFFNGGQIIIDPDGSGGVGPQNHIIDSYEMEGGIAVFLLEDNLSGTIPVSTTFRILPAPSQVIINEIAKPNNNNGRFLGFLSEGGVSTIILEEHDTTIYDYDVFYIWIKRTFYKNKKSNSDSGAIITILTERA